MGLMRWMRGSDSASAGMIGAGLNELHAAFNGTKKTLVVERESRALRRDDEAVEGDAGDEDSPLVPGSEAEAPRSRPKPWTGAGAVTIRVGSRSAGPASSSEPPAPVG